MRTRNLLIAAAAAVAAVQLLALGAKIYRLENVLAKGERHLFRAAPMDPYDAFRGRYVALSQEDLEVPYEGNEAAQTSSIWVTVERDAEGYSHFVRAGAERGAGTQLRVDKFWNREDGMKGGGAKIRIDPPFSRFYMNEKLAPKAESAYFRAASRSERKAHIAVRIKDGIGVIEELYIEGKPIEELLREEEKR